MSRPLSHHDLNDGDRPSRLELDRRLAGELPADESPALAAHRAEVEAAPLPPLDLGAVRRRAEALSFEEIEALAPEQAPRRRVPWLAVVPLLAAALALFFVLVPDAPSNRAKGSVDLDLFVQRGDQAEQVQDGATLAEGDRVRFAVAADGHESVVLLSVDGRGTVSLFYPQDPEDPPVAIRPDGRVLLDGAVQLDDAPGPELFVAVFSPASTLEALSLVEEAFAAGGQQAVLDLARRDPGLAILPIEKAP